MKEHRIITFTRNVCRGLGLRYRICNRDGRAVLYLYSIITRGYIDVCFDLLNLTEDYIPGMIAKYKQLYFCV